MSVNPSLSIISPIFKAEASIDELVRRIIHAVEPLKVPFEIVLVEDASPDQSWNRIAEIHTKYPFVRGVRMSRNFGQHAAITAGLTYSKGSYAVVLDCDLQHPPEFIPALLDKAKQGYEVVFTCSKSRAHSSTKNLFARYFHRVLNFLSDSDEIVSNHEMLTFSLISRTVVDAFLKINDHHRHYLLVLRWLGFRSTMITVDHSTRHSGVSSYSVSKLVKHAIDGITSQSKKLLWVSVGLGTLFGTAALGGIAYLILHYFGVGEMPPGWTSLAVLILSSTSALLFMLGILGIYLGNIYDQVRGRPLFIVAQELSPKQNSANLSALII